jgi:hypothetical protein
MFDGVVDGIRNGYPPNYKQEALSPQATLLSVTPCSLVHIQQPLRETLNYTLSAYLETLLNICQTTRSHQGG